PEPHLQRKNPRKNKYQLKQKDNLTQEEIDALEELQNFNSIIIKPADKGSTIVIMDKADYAWEANRQLKDREYYEPLKTPIYPETRTMVRRLLKELEEQKYINHKQLLFLTGTDPPRPRYFYLLPKIHKEPAEWAKPFQIPKRGRLFRTAVVSLMVRHTCWTTI
uniref:Uncharacterized protein n=1 Tax=Poecilia mexicana TaxID=48701 RepID=A0A3B3X7P6_9TELE